MEQLTLDIDPIPIFRVGCRVKGDSQTRIYEIEADSEQTAIDIVKTEELRWTVVLAAQINKEQKNEPNPGTSGGSPSNHRRSGAGGTGSQGPDRA